MKREHAIQRSRRKRAAMPALPQSIDDLRTLLGKQAGMSPEDVAACPLYLVGSAREIQDTLLQRREQLGISYVVIQGRDFGLLEKFAAEVVAPLAQADAR